MEMTRDTASASLSHLANYPNLFVGPHSSHSPQPPPAFHHNSGKLISSFLPFVGCFAECLNCALVKEYTIHDPVTNARSSPPPRSPTRVHV
jgi:hypothetical protein